MPHLLQIDSSADLRHSESRAHTRLFAEAWRARGAEYTVSHRDLHVHPLPHLEDAALHWSTDMRREGDRVSRGAELLQDEIVDELLAADAVVIGAPLYNYSLPSTLKAWIDRIHVPGRLAGGELLESDPPHREVTTEIMIGIEGEPSINELTLTPVEGGTLLSIVITYPSAEVRDTVLATGMVDGMEASYARLDRELQPA